MSTSFRQSVLGMEKKKGTIKELSRKAEAFNEISIASSSGVSFELQIEKGFKSPPWITLHPCKGFTGIGLSRDNEIRVLKARKEQGINCVYMPWSKAVVVSFPQKRRDCLGGKTVVSGWGRGRGRGGRRRRRRRMLLVGCEFCYSVPNL